MTVFLAQCLCPGRHCLMALAGQVDSPEAARKELVEPLSTGIRRAIAHGVLNPWCSLCRARADTWFIELAETEFATLDEARPTFERQEAEQLAANALLGDIPRSD